MAGPEEISPDSESRAGFFSGLTAYTIWGLFPIYFVATKHVSALELLSHRIVFSVPFGLLILLFRKQIAEAFQTLLTPKKLGLLTLAAIAMFANWGVYIWAIQQDQIFQGSLGYYINPLLYVLVGVAFFKETLTKMQGLAIGLATIGVLILTFYGGVFPAISLFLAVSFTIYGTLRKMIVVGAMPGLFVEVVVLLPVAIGILYWIHTTQGLKIGNVDTQTDILLILAGPLTVLPLLAFAFAARRIKLSTLGILQYIGPTLQFACGVYFGEPFTVAHALCFGFIWLGVGVFCWDAYRKRLAAIPRYPHAK
jgi:chloramphenicol-sensitive protein RarD